MTDELTTPAGHVGPSSGSIERDFWTFHQENPHVYTRLVELGRELVQKGHRKLGIGMLFEVLRWQHMRTNDPSSTFKLNNNYRSYYARLIHLREEDLAGVFETRRLSRESTLEVAAPSTPRPPAPGPTWEGRATPTLPPAMCHHRGADDPHPWEPGEYCPSGGPVPPPTESLL